MATGSEVALALGAQEQLAAKGIAVRVVSMPCTNVLDAQDAQRRQAVLPKGLPRVAVEAGGTGSWFKYVGLDGAVVGLDTYGVSVSARALFQQFAFRAAPADAAGEQV